jgi:PGF-CTERM protein
MIRSPNSSSYRTAIVVTIVLVSLLTTPVALATQEGTPDETVEPGFVVSLQETGDATVTLRMTFDLTTQNESDAFQRYSETPDARDTLKSNFRNGLERVASDASAETNRLMRIGDVTADLESRNDEGVAELTVTWTNLTATDGDALVVTEPFASGYTPDRRFTVEGPDGYTLRDATPSPDERGDNSASWQAGTDLAGFEASFAPADSSVATASGTPASNQSGPGFGPLLAMASVFGALLLARRRL